MNTARFDKRVIAYLIDIIFSVALTVTGIVFAIILFEPVREIPWYFTILISFSIAWFIYTFINSIWLYVSSGRTLGALIVGLRVVHPNLERLTFADAVCRSATLAIVPMVLANAVYMLYIHTEKTVFDRMSKTVVVDWRNRMR